MQNKNTILASKGTFLWNSVLAAAIYWGAYHAESKWFLTSNLLPFDLDVVYVRPYSYGFRTR